MDDLELLREMRSDVGSAPAAALARGREKVMAKVQASVASAPQRKATVSPIRFRRRALFASAAAALLVGGIVLVDVIRPGGPGATAEAAEVLNNAAAATIQTSDPVVGPGQYLKIATKTVSGTGGQAADLSQVRWQETSTSQMYVPADKSDVWVWNREPGMILDSMNEEAKALPDEIVKAQGAESDGQPEFVGILRSPGGVFYGKEPTVIVGTPLKEAASLPRDPRALLDLIYERTKGTGKSPDSEAFTAIADGLQTGVVPADLRAALYKAAALIQGVTVTDRHAMIDGRTGIAIGIASSGGVTGANIVIDPASGLVIGEQTVLFKDYPGYPAGTLTTWTSLRTSVVDVAP
ncbi:CU044_5270 family protein [Arthrobacter sp. M2012083]|uniref:CU044_5270 family protein n=1 Tax=Arthrobacter sp. M2012083 TaxID=1197706 RepID=UPI0002DC7498|nr:CU044_5270 family protein [Arthrobacter sp. M2012083]